MITRTRSRARWLTLGLTVAVGVMASSGGSADVTGLAAIESFWDYPRLKPHTQAHYVSSYDRTGANDDGFDGTYSALYVDDNGEHVIFDERGPGVLYTLWFTSRVSGWSELAWGRLRFYVDDEPTPRLDVDANAFFRSRIDAFRAPFVFGPFQSTGGHTSYVPLPFEQRLKITTERRAGFYNAFYHTYASDQDVDSWPGPADRQRLARLTALWSQAGDDAQPPAEADVVREGTLELSGARTPSTGPPVPGQTTVFEWEGEGAIAALRVNPLFPLTQYQLRHVILRMFWDGEEEPSVEVPLGHFFGSGLGETAVRAAPIGMSPSGPYYCMLPMPFWRSARIELVNENPQAIPTLWWQVRIRSADDAAYSQTETGYFKARYSESWPTEPDRDHRILQTDGSGVYVGQMMTVEPVRPEAKRWWEGDLRILVDGRRHPMLQGTGHEDEYLGGWSNEWLMNPYSLPMHGQPKSAELTQVDFQWSAATTVYRFFPGGIPFEAGIEVGTEHGTENSATAAYSSVAYFYERPRRMTRLDELEVGDRDSEAAHRYESEDVEAGVLESRFEGPAGEDLLRDAGRTLAGGSAFRMDAGTPSVGLRLRRLYDQALPQDAEVWVDGQLVGRWYTAATNEHRRWAESDFLLPASLTRGKASLRIEIRVQRPGWTEYRYELWGLAGSEAAAPGE